jgi:hypothetical protein
MRALGAGLTAAAGRTSQIEHSLTKGEAREAAVREQFRPHIPKRYGVSSGIVVNLAGEQSRQQDVIVSDAVENPPFIAEGGIEVHPIEAVVATVEIKSVGSPEAVVDGVEKALSVAGLMSDEPRRTYKRGKGTQLVQSTSLKPFAGLVALRSSSTRDSLLQAWAGAHVGSRPWDRSTGFVVIGDFFACWANAQGMMVPLADPTCSKIAYVEAGEDAMLMFYVVMMLGIQLYPTPDLDLNRYFEAANLDYPVESYDPKIDWQA